MNHPPRLSSNSGQSQPPGKKVEVYITMPLRTVFHILFLQPHMVFMLAQDRWTRALRVVLLVAFICGLGMAMMRVPSMLSEAGEWGKWLAREVEEAWIEDGQLRWARPEELPHTSYRGAWRIEFHPPTTEFSSEQRLGPETKGIWVSPTAVYSWWRLPGQDQPEVMPLFQNDNVLNVLPIAKLWPAGVHLKSAELKQGIRTLVWQAVPFFLIGNGLIVIFQGLFYTLIFAFIPYVFRSPLAAGGFRPVFTFYLYASIPPIVIASVYAGLGLKFATFNTFFVAAFILYLMIVMWKIGRAMRAAA